MTARRQRHAAKVLNTRRRAWDALPQEKKDATKRPGSMSGRKT